MAKSVTLAPDAVRRIRRHLGLTQVQLAKRLDVDSITVARWETGQRSCSGVYAQAMARLDLSGETVLSRPRAAEEGTPLDFKIVSLFNHKGGVSKTTTTYNLGWMLALMGYRVLLVDGDPQCNLTGMTLSLAGEEDFERVYEANPTANLHGALRPAFESMPREIEPVECFEVAKCPGLFLLPGHVRLAEYDVPLGVAHELSGSFTVMKNLPGAIGHLLKVTAERLAIDFVIVDMSPSISALNHNFLMTSTHFIVPCSPDYFCAQAIDTLARVLPEWASWPRRAAEAGVFDSAAYAVPRHTPKFLGTLNQRFRPRYGEPSSAFKRWIVRINEKVHDKLVPQLQRADMMLPNEAYDGSAVNTEPYALANISDFNSLIARSQEHGVPIYELTDAQIGLSGDPLRITKQSRDEFRSLFEHLAASVARLTGARVPSTTTSTRTAKVVQRRRR